jgi:hypothetical protein
VPKGKCKKLAAKCHNHFWYAFTFIYPQEIAEAAAIMEDGLDKLGHEPLETGKKLARLLSQRRRAEHACRTLEHLSIFQSSPSDPNLLLMLNSEDEYLEGSRIIRTLICVADALLNAENVPTASCLNKAPGHIREFASAAVKNLTGEFRETLLIDNIGKLKKLYSMLRIINGGADCRQFLVQEHSLVKGVFPSAASVKSMYFSGDKTRAPVVIRCGQEEPPEPAIKEVLDRITLTISEEHEQFIEIFGDDASILIGELMNKVLSDQLRIIVVECLRQAKQHSLLAHQRCLHSAYILFTKFCAELDSQFDGLADIVADSIDSILQPALNSLLNDEKACLDELLKLSLLPITNYWMKKRAELKRSIFTQPQASVNMALERGILFMFYDGHPIISGDEGADGLLTIDIIQRGLVLLGEAGARIIAVVGTGTAEHLLQSLLALTLQNYLIICDMIDIILHSDPPKYGFDQYHAKLMQSCHSVLNVIQIWFERHYGILSAAVSPGCYAECVRIKNEMIKAVEGKVTILAGQMIDWAIDFVKEYYYKQQRRSDFNPRDEAEQQSLLSRQQSACCEQLVLFIRRTSSSVKACAEDALAGPWLYRLGCRLLHSLLHDHLKRLVVSEAGALGLMKDCSHYAQCIPRDLCGGSLASSYETQLCQSYNALKELPKLYMVKADSLRAVMQEGALASVDIKLLFPYLTNRADSRANGKLLERAFPDMDISLFGKMTL